MKARVIAAVISVEMMTLAGCRDFGPDPAGPDRQPPSSGVSTNQQSAPQPGDRDRKDTRWQHMDDQQFAADVSRAAGRVTIGLKDPAAADGVDNRGQVLVSPTAVREAKEALRAMGITPLYEFRRIPAIVADVSPELAVVLRRNPVVDYIQPSLPGEYFAQVTPWNVTKVKAPPAWSYSTGSGVKLLILDSGVDSLARDLSIPVAWRCVNASLSVWDRLGHGTFVAGVAGALNNSLDVVGVAYGVSLWSANNEVNLAPNAAESACAVDAARVNGVSVVNMSFGLSPYTALTDAINGGYNQDNMIFVAAVGNGGGGPVDYPASLSNVIGATATDSTNAHASFANVGSQVELSAPGVDVLSTSLPNGSVCSNGGFTATCSGTSFAAPHVSAAAAILARFTRRGRTRRFATACGVLRPTSVRPDSTTRLATGCSTSSRRPARP